MIKRGHMGTGVINGRHDHRRHSGARHGVDRVDNTRIDNTRHEAARLDNPRLDGARQDDGRNDDARRDARQDGARHDGGEWHAEASFRRVPPPPLADEQATAQAADRFVDDQLFEEDVRAVVSMMRPHRRERLMGWAEYRTGGANFRATISWDESFQQAAQSPEEQWLAVPRLTDVLESILVGSVKDQDELTTAEEFDVYRGVVRELYRRLDEMQSRYE